MGCGPAPLRASDPPTRRRRGDRRSQQGETSDHSLQQKLFRHLWPPFRRGRAFFFNEELAEVLVDKNGL